MSIDIVNLIESNPLTTLVGNYQSSMIDKVKANFNTYEQQLFVSSFYCYLNYNETDFAIDLDNIWQWLGFTQKMSAKRLLENCLIIDTDYKNLLYFDVKQDKKHGGHNKETIMLTIPAFKRFCLRAGTKKAHQIHEYFIKLEKIMHKVVAEENKEMTEKLKIKDKEIADKDAEMAKREIEYQTKLKKQKEIEREKVLLSQFAVSIPIVYIIRVKTHENGEFVVKIGESRRGIQNRFAEHKSHYPECVLLDVFTAIQSKDFEDYIHNHPKIRCNQVRDMPGHETENELFLVGKNLTYQIILDVINSQVDNFQEYGTKKLELEIEKLKIIATNHSSPAIAQLLETNQQIEESNKQLHARINKLENMLEKLLETRSAVVRTQTGFQEPLPTLGPRVQKINPDTLQLIKVYESATELMTEDRSIKRPSLSKAVLENIVYNGFRWMFVERDMDPKIIHGIRPTRITTRKNMDYVAKINKDQDEILNVYLDRKTAALMNGYSSGGLDTSVKNGTITQGHYYRLYSDCDKTLIEKFEEKYGKDVFLYKDGFGIFDATTDKLIREFKCKYDCIVAQKISDKTLEKSMRENKPYNGLKFGPIPPRLCCYP
jgi:cell division septum initiation protein DivIVA